MSRDRYTRPMRLVVVVVGMALLASAACGIEEKRAKRSEEFSAARLDGKFGADDPIIQMLSPQERAALDDAGLMGEPLPPPDPAEVAADGQKIGFDGKPQSTSDQVGDAVMSVLSVGFTIGMMAAPYLLF